MKTLEVPVVDFKRHFSEYVSRTRHGGERVIVTSHHKSVAAVVSMEDLRRLERQDDMAGLRAVAGRWPDFDEIDSAVHEAIEQRSGETGRRVSL